MNDTELLEILESVNNTIESQNKRINLMEKRLDVLNQRLRIQRATMQNLLETRPI